MMPFLYVFIGGGLGSVCRYILSKIWVASIFPYGTLTANILSSLILGFLIGLHSDELLRSEHRLLLMTGFCGGFSTFSTFSGEVVELYQSGQGSLAIGYIVTSLIAGILSIVAGFFISRLVIS